MKHIDDIRALVKTLQQSTRFHALIIQSPPGWAKSSTIDRVMNELGIPFRALGSYSTPLFIYNALCESPEQTLVLDDCARLFEDSTAMAILKAAAWASAGTDGGRKATWNSSSERVRQPEIEFKGKLILLTNNLPVGRNTEAFLSRTLYMSIAFNNDEVAEMLREASKSADVYPDACTARQVAEYLIDRLASYDQGRINLRTLQMGYDVAVNNPQAWEPLLDRLLPKGSPRVLAGNLAATGMPSEEQAREFSRLTGLSRRTFFKYRKQSEAEVDEVHRAQVPPWIPEVAGG